jgi:hypothetical protein
MFGIKTKTEKDIAIKDFLHKHLSDKLIIIADPSDDSLYMKFGKNFVLTKIKSMDGKNHKVVKNVLKYSRFKSNIDRFLGGMIDALQLSVQNGNQFYQWLDGALYAISKAITIKKKETYATKEESSGNPG